MNSSATAPSIDAVVVAEREVPHRSDRDRVVDHDGALLDVADAENGHLRLVDDRHPEERPEDAGVRDRERAAADFVRLELLRARARREIRDRAAQAEQVLLVGILDDGDDQSPVERDRDAEVHVLVIDDVVAVDRRVDDGHGAKRFDDGLQNEREIRQLGAGALVLRLLRFANLRDAREVDLEHRVHVRRRPPAHDHVLGDLLAHHRHLLDVIRRARLERRRGHGSARERRLRGRPARLSSRLPALPAPPARRNPRMSSLVTRPEMPVPWICEISTLCSFAILRTSGDDRWRMRALRRLAGGPEGRPGSVAVQPAPDVAGRRARPAARRAIGLRREASVPRAAGVGRTWRRGRATAPRASRWPAPITATTVLTGTVSPSLCRISVTTPAAGAGISASTLSVEISKSGSSRSTLSPTFLIQRTIVPSAIDSPICGITTSVGHNLRLSRTRLIQLP